MLKCGCLFKKNENFFSRFVSFSSWNYSSILWLCLQLEEILAHPDLEFLVCLFNKQNPNQIPPTPKPSKHCIYTNMKTGRLWCSARHFTCWQHGIQKQTFVCCCPNDNNWKAWGEELSNNSVRVHIKFFALAS